MPHHLRFDHRTREGRAIHKLFTAVQNDVQERNGRWNGAALVELLDQWFTEPGYVAAPASTVDIRP